MSATPARSPARATLAQQGIWFNERLGGIGTVYSMPFSVTFEGPLDVPALAAACSALVDRHPLLACAAGERNGVPHLVDAAERPGLRIEEAGPADLDARLRAEILRPFDLEAGPLIRMTLFVLGPRLHRLLVVVHHLVFDGESTSVFLDDLADLYRAEVVGDRVDAAPLGFGGLAEQEDARVAAKLSFAREFWSSRRQEPGEVILPGLTGPVPAADDGAAVEFTLRDDQRAALDRLAEEIGAGRFEIVLASLHVLLYRYGDSTPVIAVDLGTRTEDTRRHIGCFVNELPVAARPGPEWSFRRFVQDQRFAHGLRGDLRGLFRLREVPLSRAVSGVRPGVALAPVSLGYRRRRPAPDFPKVSAHVDWALFNHTVRGALRAHMVDGPEEFGVILQYNPRAMTPADVRRLAAHWLRLLDAVAADPDTPLSEVPMLGADETETLLTAWNDTATAYPAATLPGLFAEQARRTPEAVAVVSGDETMTYARLHAEVEGMAARLRETGVAEGSLVAIHAERSARTLVAMLGVLRAGGAYLPLDPDHPAERLAMVIEDSRAEIVLTGERLRDRLPCHRGPVLVLEELVPEEPGPPAGALPDGPRPDDLAYVIYTSGSTGRPKGVEIPHSALANLLRAMRDRLGAEPGDAWVALTSLAFDISALELYLPLVTGGRVVVAPEDSARDGRALVALIERHRVSHVQATPSGWRMLLDSGFTGPGVTALAGGEALPAALARELLARTRRLVNVYGPTETTIWSTCADVTEVTGAVPIGTPLANTRVYVLDGRLGLLPIGVPGELCVAGDGVAFGYRDRPELTAERFPTDPYGGGRLYRTGDRARWRPDGRLEFIGRLDGQIKLRGHRIELGEIEARLLEHPDVRSAAVIAPEDDDGERRIVAYVVPRVPSDIREHCARTLPPYMIPADFADLAELPLTPNGKLDRAALPSPSPRPARLPASAGPVAYSGTQALIHEIWCAVLGVTEVGPHDDLFELGGHSLTITQIAARVRTRLGADLPLHLYYDTPTIAGIAAAVDDLGGGTTR
ncbi:UNVERIFIED_ORG: amino acid adenylation domain-containing protein [Microbispora rosea subsp. rosea]